jgi:hypothetical protein
MDGGTSGFIFTSETTSPSTSSYTKKGPDLKPGPSSVSFPGFLSLLIRFERVTRVKHQDSRRGTEKACASRKDVKNAKEGDVQLIVKPDVHMASVNHVFDPTTKLAALSILV